MRAKSVKISLILTLGLVFITVGIVAYALDDDSSAESIDWSVTLTGRNGEERVLKYDEITAMSSSEGDGGFFTTVGVINGPYTIKGVPIETICQAIGGLSSSDIVNVSAVDGYSAVFDYEQLNGDIDTFDAETMRLVPHEKLEVLIIYEQDGELLSHNDGRPLRLGIISDRGLLTEGHHWVKWIDKIEVVSLD